MRKVHAECLGCCAVNRLYLDIRDALASPAGGGSSLFDANPDGKHVIIQYVSSTIATPPAAVVAAQVHNSG